MLWDSDVARVEVHLVSSQRVPPDQRIKHKRRSEEAARALAGEITNSLYSR